MSNTATRRGEEPTRSEQYPDCPECGKPDEVENTNLYTEHADPGGYGPKRTHAEFWCYRCEHEWGLVN